jgi:hypothetical protein
MSLIDDALTAHQQAVADAEALLRKKEDDAFESAVQSAASWAGNLLGGGEETEFLRTPANWEFVETRWVRGITSPATHATAQGVVDCLDQSGMRFQYWCETESVNSAKHHFSVLLARADVHDLRPRPSTRWEAIYEYVDLGSGGRQHLGQLVAEGRVLIVLNSGTEITSGELLRRRQWVDQQSQAITWTTTDTKEQVADLYGNYWASIQPIEDPASDGWSWSLNLRSGPTREYDKLADGEVDREGDAKRVVVQYLIENYLLETAL